MLAGDISVLSKFPNSTQRIWQECAVVERNTI